MFGLIVIGLVLYLVFFQPQLIVQWLAAFIIGFIGAFLMAQANGGSVNTFILWFMIDYTFVWVVLHYFLNRNKASS